MGPYHALRLPKSSQCDPSVLGGSFHVPISSVLFVEAAAIVPIPMHDRAETERRAAPAVCEVELLKHKFGLHRDAGSGAYWLVDHLTRMTRKNYAHS